MSSVDNLKLVRKSISDSPNKKNIMGFGLDAYCSCIMDHTHRIKFNLGSEEGSLNFLGFIKNDNNFDNMFIPNFPHADFQAIEGEAGYITKGHVLRFLDLLIAGEKNLERCWRKSKDER